MSNEQLVHATQSSDLASRAYVVRDVDRVAAMAGGNILGGLLFRFAESGQTQWGRQIVLILTRRATKRLRIGRLIAERVAACALMEYACAHCQTCLGARDTMTADGLKIVCGTCEGSGKHRFTNASRRAQVGTYGTRIDEAFAQCHQDMAGAVDAFLARTYGRLA